MRITFNGIERLEEKLIQKSRADFDAVGKKNARDIYARSQRSGGTPVDSAQLRLSAQYRGDEVGYGVHYAPHVEYGHRLINGGYVPGQYFLKRNVDTQRPIYKQDLLEKLRE
ncbi:hypothetical protein ACTQ5K_02755 [Niallia sp. Sow4_A1]|uniref:hypothetical protein n=1 Tax=Niallia sp. Sow4_A1 TaxID=3438793 RepID=UPI003F96700E